MEWTDVQKHMRAKFRLEDDQPNMLSMVWSYDDGRKQKILVRRFMSGDREHVEFKSPVARVGAIDPMVLLEDNAKLPMAAVARSGDLFIVIHNALLGTLGVADFDFLLERVAAVADNLEEKYSRGDSF